MREVAPEKMNFGVICTKRVIKATTGNEGETEKLQVCKLKRRQFKTEP